MLYLISCDYAPVFAIFCDKFDQKVALARSSLKNSCRLTMGQHETDDPSPVSSTKRDFRVAVVGSNKLEEMSNRIDCVLPPFAAVHRLFAWGSREITPFLLQQPVCNDLADPRGTVILDPGLRAARIERDEWTLDEFIKARAQWRLAALPSQLNAALEQTATTGSWNLDRAIWGFSYTWNLDMLKKELLTLAKVAHETPELLPSSEREPAPPQIVIYTRPTKSDEFANLLQGLSYFGIRGVHSAGVITPLNTSIRTPQITIACVDTIALVRCTQSLNTTPLCTADSRQRYTG
jgi:hypothetical protein